MLLSEFKQHAKSPTAVKRNVRYLLELCSENDVKPEQINLEIFGDSIKGTPRDLNKIFFSKIKTMNATTADISGKTTLAPADVEALDDLGKSFLKNSKDAIHNQILAHESRISNYQTGIMDEARFLAEQTRKLHDVKETKFSDTVSNIIRAGFWELLEIYSKKSTSNLIAKFVSKEIILEEKRTGPKLNFGKIVVNFYRDGLIKGADYRKQYFANIFYGNKCHPFMSSDGNICYGTGQSQASQLRTAQQYEDSFLLLQNLLNRYSAEGPYVTFGRFYTDGRTRWGGKPWLFALSEAELTKRGISTNKKEYQDKYVHPGTFKKDLKGQNYIHDFLCWNCQHQFDMNKATESCPSCQMVLPYYPEIHL